MLTSIRLDRARRLLLSASRRGLVAKKVTIAKGKKQGKQMKVWVRNTPKPLKRGMTTTEAGINPKKLKLHSGYIRETTVTKYGDDVDFIVNNGSVSMTVNGSTSSGGANHARSCVTELMKLSKSVFSKIEDNTILYCRPFDSSLDKRYKKETIYSSFGFRNTDGEMYGVVKSGFILKPDDLVLDELKNKLTSGTGSRPLDDDGFNVFGFNSSGFHRNGTLYDDNGFDQYGLDRDGYNARGFDFYNTHRNGTLYDENGENIWGVRRRDSGFLMTSSQKVDDILFRYFHDQITEEEFNKAIDSIPGADNILAEYVNALIPSPSALPVKLAIKQNDHKRRMRAMGDRDVT